MVVSVSSITATHVLDLARQMADRRLLGKYYTVLPRRWTPRVDPERTVRFLALTPIIALGMKQSLPIAGDNFYWHTNRAFDHWLSRRVEPCDVIHCASGCALQTFRTARPRTGAIGICDSGTSHVRVQQSIVNEEYARWGAEVVSNQQRLIERAEAEYDAADLITVPSTFAKQTFVEAGIDARRIAVAPYGVDQADYYPVPRRDDVFRVLFVGTLSLRKGIQYLLEAVAPLRLPNAELALCGVSTAMTADVLASYRGSIPLKLLGAVPDSRTNMRTVMSQACVLVLPSIEDGFGLVILQAMACGIPVIASTSTGGPDVITDGADGFLVPPRDAVAIRDRVRQLFEDRALLNSMKQAALARVAAMKGWTQYGDAVELAYRGALQSQSSAA